MINAYTSIINYSDESDAFDEYLKKKYLFDLFKGLLEEFADINIFKGIVKYILWAYSLESDMLLMNGETFGKTSDRIFKKTKLPDTIYSDVALLESDSVRDCIEKWLQFQNEEEYTNYCHFRDLRREMLASSIGKITKATLEQDYEQKMKNAYHAKELLEMMKEALAKYVQNSPKLKNSIKAFDAVTINRNTATVEDFLNKSR